MAPNVRWLAVGLLAVLGVLWGDGSALALEEFDKAARLAMVGDYEGALKEYETFLSRNPDHRLAPLAGMAVGTIHLEVREDYGEASRKYDQVVTRYPSSPWAPEAARRKGEAAEALEDWAAAGEAYDEALRLAAEQGNNQSADWVNEVTGRAANCFYQVGDHERVLGTYERVLDSSPPAAVGATALYRMGETYEAMDQPEKAAGSYAAVLETYPGASRELRQQAMGKRDLIDQHVRFDWKPYELNAESTALIQQRDFAGALEKCGEIETCCKNPRLLECVEYRKIALETTLSGDYEKGRRRLGAYLETYPRGQLAAAVEQNLDQYAQIMDAKKQVDENPNDAQSMEALGTVYLRAGSFQVAVETLEKARYLDPENPGTRRMLGYAYNAVGRPDDAAREFEKFLEANPDDTNALNMVGYAYLGQQQYEKAIPYFRRYAELAPDEANAHDSLGEGLFRAGRLEESAKEYERAIELDSNFYNSYVFLGQVYQQMGETEKAIDAYERLLGLNPPGSQADQARAALEQLRSQ